MRGRLRAPGFARPDHGPKQTRGGAPEEGDQAAEKGRRPAFIRMKSSREFPSKFPKKTPGKIWKIKNIHEKSCSTLFLKLTTDDTIKSFILVEGWLRKYASPRITPISCLSIGRGNVNPSLLCQNLNSKIK